MKKKQKKQIKFSFRISLFTFFILTLVPLVSLLNPGLPITHDGKDHVARIANFYANLSDGVFLPRWGENLNWGYGHPVLMFLYPLPSYMASLFHFLGFSFVDSVKLVFGISFILSGFAMYLWLQTLLPRTAAIVGGLLYLFAPYRFVDLYVRGAIGEHVAFIFPPLVLYFLFKLSQKVSYWYVLGGAVSLGGFILAHNAVSLMFLPFIFFSALFLLWQSPARKSFLLNTLYIVLFGFALSAFFWLPAFMEGKYTLRDIVTEGLVTERFVSLPQLFYGPWNYGQSGEFTVQVGILQWLSVFLVIPLIWFFRKKKNTQWVFLLGVLVYFLLTIFLMTPFSTIVWEKVSLLQKFQFPWRFLSVSVFATAVLGAYVFAAFFQKRQTLGAFIIIAALLLFHKDYMAPKAYLEKPESFYSGVYAGTTDTGESSPLWSVRFMEQYPKALIEVIDGKATIHEGTRTATRHQYSIAAETPVTVRENTLYFPGWQVLVDGKQVPVEFQDPSNRGIMTFAVSEGKHAILVEFVDTKIRVVAQAISAGSLFVLLLLGILRRKLWRN